MRTREEVEKAAHSLGDERWSVWMKCFIHTWQALPQTESGEHYCPDCCTLWTSNGAIQNVPTRPVSQVRSAPSAPSGDEMPRTSPKRTPAIPINRP